MSGVFVEIERPEIMNLKETAAYLQVHPMTAYRHAKEKRLPAFKVGGQWRFMRSNLDQWVENEMKRGFASQPAQT